jgi:flagellar biosynthesis chaperone FliJ
MDKTLSELILYKPDDLDKYLRALQRDLSVRTQVNVKLEKEVRVSEANKMAINNFMDRYEVTIEEQFNNLCSLNEDFKKEISLNKELKDKSLEFKKTLESDRCVNIKNKLNQIKNMKQELENFLEERGIPAPKI